MAAIILYIFSMHLSSIRADSAGPIANTRLLAAKRTALSFSILLLLMTTATLSLAAEPALPVLVPQIAILTLPDATFHSELTKAISQAKQQITMAYFMIKPKNSSRSKPMQVLQELIKARKRGVDVSVLLDRSGHYQSVDNANDQSADILRRNGIRVRFDQPDRTTHVKLTIIDHRLCFIGSHNLTQAALTYNNELSLLIDSPELAAKLEKYTAALH